MMARQYIPVPQKQQSAQKKTEGRSGIDRSAQFSAINLAAGIAGIPKLQLPDSATNPVKPSIGQAGLKLPSLPKYAKH